MASTLLQTGQRTEALQELETAFGLRQLDDIPAWDFLAHLFTCVLDYERAKTLFAAMTENPDIRKMETVMGNAVRFAVCSGDISYLHELSEIEQLTDGSVDAMTAGQALNVLDESGMIKHVAAHQRIVSEVLEGVQSWIGAAPIGESSGSVIIEVERYLQFGVADRQVLRRQITDALGVYYVDQGLAPGHYMTHLHTTLIDMPEPLGATIAA